MGNHKDVVQYEIGISVLGAVENAIVQGLVLEYPAVMLLDEKQVVNDSARADFQGVNWQPLKEDQKNLLNLLFLLLSIVVVH